MMPAPRPLLPATALAVARHRARAPVAITASFDMLGGRARRPATHGGDTVGQHACVVERNKMFRGEPAREHCISIRDAQGAPSCSTRIGAFKIPRYTPR